MNAARTRIGRIKLKAGGEVVMLNRPKAGEVNQHMRESVAFRLDERQWDAYVLFVIGADPETPGCPWANVSYCSSSDHFPIGALGEIAAAYLIRDLAAQRGASEALNRLGYADDGWEPEAS